MSNFLDFYRLFVWPPASLWQRGEIFSSFWSNFYMYGRSTYLRWDFARFIDCDFKKYFPTARQAVKLSKTHWDLVSQIKMQRPEPGQGRPSGPLLITSSWRATSCWTVWTKPCTETTSALATEPRSGPGSLPSRGATRVWTVWWVWVTLHTTVTISRI